MPMPEHTKFLRVLVALAMVCTTLAATAQGSSDSEEETADNLYDSDKLFVGYVAGGLNMSQIAGDLMAGYRRAGANVGVGTYIMYHPIVSNSIEISYSMKGSQSSFTNSDPERFRRFIYDYMEIPVLFNFHDRRIAIFHVGASFGRLFRNRIESGLFEQDVASIKPWEFGAVIGATLRFKDKFGVQVKGTFSLNNINDGAWVNQYGGGGTEESRARQGGLYHNSIALRFVYLFL